MKRNGLAARTAHLYRKIDNCIDNNDKEEAKLWVRRLVLAEKIRAIKFLPTKPLPKPKKNKEYDPRELVAFGVRKATVNRIEAEKKVVIDNLSKELRKQGGRPKPSRPDEY